MLGNAKDPSMAEEIFRGLDQDSSGQVDFTEFVTMVACLTAVTNEMLCKQE